MWETFSAGAQQTPWCSVFVSRTHLGHWHRVSSRVMTKTESIVTPIPTLRTPALLLKLFLPSFVSRAKSNVSSCYCRSMTLAISKICHPSLFVPTPKALPKAFVLNRALHAHRAQEAFPGTVTPYWTHAFVGAAVMPVPPKRC